MRHPQHSSSSSSPDLANDSADLLDDLTADWDDAVLDKLADRISDKMIAELAESGRTIAQQLQPKTTQKALASDMLPTSEACLAKIKQHYAEAVAIRAKKQGHATEWYLVDILVPFERSLCTLLNTQSFPEALGEKYIVMIDQAMHYADQYAISCETYKTQKPNVKIELQNMAAYVVGYLSVLKCWRAVANCQVAKSMIMQTDNAQTLSVKIDRYMSAALNDCIESARAIGRQNVILKAQKLILNDFTGCLSLHNVIYEGIKVTLQMIGVRLKLTEQQQNQYRQMLNELGYVIKQIAFPLLKQENKAHYQQIIDLLMYACETILPKQQHYRPPLKLTTDLAYVIDASLPQAFKETTSQVGTMTKSQKIATRQKRILALLEEQLVAIFADWVKSESLAQPYVAREVDLNQINYYQQVFGILFQDEIDVLKVDPSSLQAKVLEATALAWKTDLLFNHAGNLFFNAGAFLTLSNNSITAKLHILRSIYYFHKCDDLQAQKHLVTAELMMQDECVDSEHRFIIRLICLLVGLALANDVNFAAQLMISVDKLSLTLYEMIALAKEAKDLSPSHSALQQLLIHRYLKRIKQMVMLHKSGAISLVLLQDSMLVNRLQSFIKLIDEYINLQMTMDSHDDLNAANLLCSSYAMFFNKDIQFFHNQTQQAREWLKKMRVTPFSNAVDLQRAVSSHAKQLRTLLTEINRHTQACILDQFWQNKLKMLCVDALHISASTLSYLKNIDVKDLASLKPSLNDFHNSVLECIYAATLFEVANQEAHIFREKLNITLMISLLDLWQVKCVVDARAMTVAINENVAQLMMNWVTSLDGLLPLYTLINLAKTIEHTLYWADAQNIQMLIDSQIVLFLEKHFQFLWRRIYRPLMSHMFFDPEANQHFIQNILSVLEQLQSVLVICVDKAVGFDDSLLATIELKIICDQVNQAIEDYSSAKAKQACAQLEALELQVLAMSTRDDFICDSSEDIVALKLPVEDMKRIAMSQHYQTHAVNASLILQGLLKGLNDRAQYIDRTSIEKALKMSLKIDELLNIAYSDKADLLARYKATRCVCDMLLEAEYVMFNFRVLICQLFSHEIHRLYMRVSPQSTEFSSCYYGLMDNMLSAYSNAISSMLTGMAFVPEQHTRWHTMLEMSAKICQNVLKPALLTCIPFMQAPITFCSDLLERLQGIDDSINQLCRTCALHDETRGLLSSAIALLREIRQISPNNKQHQPRLLLSRFIDDIDLEPKKCDEHMDAQLPVTDCQHCQILNRQQTLDAFVGDCLHLLPVADGIFPSKQSTTQGVDEIASLRTILADSHRLFHQMHCHYANIEFSNVKHDKHEDNFVERINALFSHVDLSVIECELATRICVDAVSTQYYVGDYPAQLKQMLNTQHRLLLTIHDLYRTRATLPLDTLHDAEIIAQLATMMREINTEIRDPYFQMYCYFRVIEALSETAAIEQHISNIINFTYDFAYCLIMHPHVKQMTLPCVVRGVLMAVIELGENAVARVADAQHSIGQLANKFAIGRDIIFRQIYILGQEELLCQHQNETDESLQANSRDSTVPQPVEIQVSHSEFQSSIRTLIEIIGVNYQAGVADIAIDNAIKLQHLTLVFQTFNELIHRIINYMKVPTSSAQSTFVRDIAATLKSLCDVQMRDAFRQLLLLTLQPEKIDGWVKIKAIIAKCDNEFAKMQPSKAMANAPLSVAMQYARTWMVRHKTYMNQFDAPLMLQLTSAGLIAPGRVIKALSGKSILVYQCIVKLDLALRSWQEFTRMLLKHQHKQNKLKARLNELQVSKASIESLVAKAHDAVLYFTYEANGEFCVIDHVEFARQLLAKANLYYSMLQFYLVGIQAELTFTDVFHQFDASVASCAEVPMLLQYTDEVKRSLITTLPPRIIADVTIHPQLITLALMVAECLLNAENDLPDLTSQSKSAIITHLKMMLNHISLDAIKPLRDKVKLLEQKWLMLPQPSRFDADLPTDTVSQQSNGQKDKKQTKKKHKKLQEARSVGAKSTTLPKTATGSTAKDTPKVFDQPITATLHTTDTQSAEQSRIEMSVVTDDELLSAQADMLPGVAAGELVLASTTSSNQRPRHRLRSLSDNPAICDFFSPMERSVTISVVQGESRRYRSSTSDILFSKMLARYGVQAQSIDWAARMREPRSASPQAYLTERVASHVNRQLYAIEVPPHRPLQPYHPADEAARTMAPNAEQAQSTAPPDFSTDREGVYLQDVHAAVRASLEPDWTVVKMKR